MGFLVLQGDARRLPIASGVVQCCVTSPPYFGLRNYGVDGQIGAEETPADYVDVMVNVFREVRRVLREDGSVWLNLGDSYAGGGGGNYGDGKSVRSQGGQQVTNVRNRPAWLSNAGLKAKDLIGIPWRVALALQDDGWFLRSDCIWHKPNPMPESVVDRPGRSHEYIFMFSKSPSYFYDSEAVKEPDCGRAAGNVNGFKDRQGAASFHAKSGGVGSDGWIPGTGRNLRSVWTITVGSFPGSHFATFPTRIPEICIKAGTSEKGCCPACRAPWVRVVEKDRIPTRPGTNSKVNRASSHDDSPYNEHNGMIVGNRDPLRHCTATRTVGWEPSCRCGRADTTPCIVFDPFGGAFTTALVAHSLGRIGIGTELNREYCEMGHRRISRPHAPVVRPSDAEIEMPLFAKH